ncbi:ankyrin repeat-containing domain protein, partial [Coprinopsis sp. MPI-PUGE-AT-0042]
HASLQLDALRGCANVYAVEKTLEDFPRQIQDVYRKTWRRIEAQSPDMSVIAKNALVWVLCARRSLTIKELRHAVATCPDTHKFDRRRLVDEATLMGLCRGLVNVEEETNIVRFVHYTAKDVVNDLVSQSFPYPHSLPAAVCMALLAEHGFQQTSLKDEHALKASLKAEPLLAYAYEDWPTHAHKSLEDTSLACQLSQFIQGCCAFPVLMYVDSGIALVDILEPLHMAANFDFPLSVVGSAHLCDPNHPTPHREQTPLIVTVMENSLSAMRELLSLPGILVNVADKEGEIPLVYAAEWNKEASLSLLLAHPKINVNATDSYGRTALMMAYSEEAANLLLAHRKIKPNLVDSDGDTALMRASRFGRLEVVRVLLADPRVQVNLKSKAGKTALEMAGERYWGDYEPYDQIIELLRTHSDREHGHSRNSLKNMLHRALPFAKK